MPQMGVSVAEGTIIEWLKQPGDWVEADETICGGDARTRSTSRSRRPPPAG